MVKNPPANQETQVGKVLWRRKWQPSPVFLPGKSHGQRSLVGYGPWGCKELDMSERLTYIALKEGPTILDQTECPSIFSH